MTNRYRGKKRNPKQRFTKSVQKLPQSLPIYLSRNELGMLATSLIVSRSVVCETNKDKTLSDNTLNILLSNLFVLDPSLSKTLREYSNEVKAETKQRSQTFKNESIKSQ